MKCRLWFSFQKKSGNVDGSVPPNIEVQNFRKSRPGSWLKNIVIWSFGNPLPRGSWKLVGLGTDSATRGLQNRLRAQVAIDYCSSWNGLHCPSRVTWSKSSSSTKWLAEGAYLVPTRNPFSVVFYPSYITDLHLCLSSRPISAGQPSSSRLPHTVSRLNSSSFCFTYTPALRLIGRRPHLPALLSTCSPVSILECSNRAKRERALTDSRVPPGFSRNSGGPQAPPP
ncbi:uncharacterized protein LY79DRAFT_256264 [Colletotrichum navitas]|uniref:Uncharacterized protein n=1 Tax=Colletotrichum navitas TaxID=681940 RepID=A0AAD8VBT0_9PEZI|nr:uncharacterized protein LY79DRAFT_256264 [Colletotrichum navitas]KAK1598775.1 hypothetical protein LY79DRAFT_256264 [Colletotrichum navitas]